MGFGLGVGRFGLAPFAGPATAPFIAGYIGVSGTSWRWLFWVLCIFASFCGLIGKSTHVQYRNIVRLD